MLTIDCLDNPVMLILKNGKMFKGHSLKSEKRFQTEFFLITDVNDTKNCLTLMLLRPCHVCSDKVVFEPTDECITIDLNCFCGYQSIPNTCIRKCNHPQTHIKDCICIPFTMTPGNDVIVLWRSNIIADQYGTINLCIEQGKAKHLTLRVYFNDLCEYRTYRLTNQKTHNFTVTNYARIEIIRSKTKSKITGTFEIKSHSVI